MADNVLGTIVNYSLIVAAYCRPKVESFKDDQFKFKTFLVGRFGDDAQWVMLSE